MQAIRAASVKPARIGFAPVGLSKIPATDSAADLAAAREAAFAVNAETAWTNSWWMDPVFLGHYPEQGLRFFGEHVPRIAAGDLELISQPVDFCGINIYQGQYVRAGDAGPEPVTTPVGYPDHGLRVAGDTGGDVLGAALVLGALPKADRDHRERSLVA